MNNDYNRSPQEVLEELGSCPTGLTEQQAAERLAEKGDNRRGGRRDRHYNTAESGARLRGQ